MKINLIIFIFFYTIQNGFSQDCYQVEEIKRKFFTGDYWFIESLFDSCSENYKNDFLKLNKVEVVKRDYNNLLYFYQMTFIRLFSEKNLFTLFELSKKIFIIFDESLKLKIENRNKLIYNFSKFFIISKKFNELKEILDFAMEEKSIIYYKIEFLKSVYYFQMNDDKKSLLLLENIYIKLNTKQKFTFKDRFLEHVNLLIARINFKKGNFEKALSFYERINNDSQFFEKAFFEIAWVYFSKSNFDVALEKFSYLEFFRKPYNYVNKGNLDPVKLNYSDYFYSYYLMGLTYQKLNQFDKAIYYYKENIKFYENHKFEVENVLNNLALYDQKELLEEGYYFDRKKAYYSVFETWLTESEIYKFWSIFNQLRSILSFLNQYNFGTIYFELDKINGERKKIVNVMLNMKKYYEDLYYLDLAEIRKKINANISKAAIKNEFSIVDVNWYLKKKYYNLMNVNSSYGELSVFE